MDKIIRCDLGWTETSNTTETIQTPIERGIISVDNANKKYELRVEKGGERHTYVNECPTGEVLTPSTPPTYPDSVTVATGSPGCNPYPLYPFDCEWTCAVGLGEEVWVGLIGVPGARISGVCVDYPLTKVQCIAGPSLIDFSGSFFGCEASSPAGPHGATWGYCETSIGWIISRCWQE